MENNEDLSRVIADNLIYYRKKASLTQNELANKINYSDKSISKWERGDGTPDVFVLSELAKLYGLTVNDFLTTKKKERVANFFISKVLISVIAVVIVWLVATLTFFILNIVDPTLKDQIRVWLCFIYAIPVSFIVVSIFIYKFFDRFYNVISLSGLLWTFVLSMDLTFYGREGIDLLYIVAIPFNVVLILFYFKKYWFKNKKKKNK